MINYLSTKQGNKKLNLFYSICLFFLIAQSSSRAFEEEYDIKNIPFQLIQNAGAVVRTDEIRFEISDYQYAYMKVKYAVTIFTKDNQHYGEIKLWYDNFKTIEELNGFIYDSKGELIRELEDSDIKDYSNFKSYSIYSDTRVKYISLYHDKFPYTVEFLYEVSYDGYLNWPTWYSRSSLDPVEKSTFEIVTPENYDLRYWCNMADVKPEITIDDGDKLYYWKENDLIKLPKDIFGEHIEDFATIVMIAPADFEIDGYRGNMESWKTFGQWYFNLCKDRDVLPETALNEINQGLDPKMDIKEKVEFLYNYLQLKTRYISIQLGIGKWQPLDAAYVYKNGYGDCKALSNYMVSMLKSAGVNAYPVIIHNGSASTPLIEEFPSNQFNHVVVIVPLEQDTMWLECTSRILPPGSIGWSNENRNALMVTPEGGVIVKTPESNSSKNLQIKECEIKMSPTGEADVICKAKWSGNQYNYVLRIAENSTPEEQEKWIKNLLEVPNIKLKKFNFSLDNAIQSEIELYLEIVLPHYGSISGSRIFFNPNLLERRTSVPEIVKIRLSPVRFIYPYLDIDTVYYELPDNFKAEAVPTETNIKSSFGNFISRTIITDENKMLFIRYLEIKEYEVPAENYNEYQKFFADVFKADKQQVVLVKTNK